MSVANIAKRVPALRFPEFEGEWAKEPLGQLAKLQGGYAFKSEDFSTVGMDVVRISNISAKSGAVDLTSVVRHPQILRDENFRINKGDILIALSGATTGKACIYNLDDIAYLNQRVGLLKKSSEKLHYDYLATLVFSSIFSKQLLATLVAGAQPNVSPKDIEKFVFGFPSLPEQKKIAAFLGGVDAKIAGLKARQEGLERYKRGLMQALFSQRLRFTKPDGTAFPDWEEKKADELFRSVSNKDHNGDLPILAVTQEHGAVLRDDIDIDIKSSANSVLSYKIIEVGDFIISLRSFQGGIEYSNILGICSPAYTVLKPNLPIVDGFYKQYFKKEEFISRLSATVVGIRDGKQISYSAFSTMKLLYPHPDEQQKRR
ncbi:MAG: restriction endonuclease subunit S [Cognatishimia sp.]